MDRVGELHVHDADDEAHRRALLAAMLGVYAAAEAPVDFARMLPGEARPMSARAAVQTIKRARGALRDRAFRVCSARLAVGAYLERRDDLHQCLIDLAGHEVDRAIAKKLSEQDRLTQGIVMNHAYDVLGEVVPASASAHASKELVTQSNLDIRTMQTTVEVATEGSGDFQRLAEWMDPRSWQSSPFWIASRKVIEVGGRFVPDPHQPPLGQSWEGYFYEYIRWAVNESVISAFQCYLDVDFQVDAVRRRVELSFSLHSCAGSMLLARIAEGGVEIDSGGSTAAPIGRPRSPGRYEVSSLKRIRYSDRLTRSTPNQGGDGAGQTLNYMAPAVVALWMNDLVYESVLAWTQGGSAPRVR
ncbi:hypothetical protein A7982_12425 [Minicystis rosea]|nr:hypothetical protein A7982_12425 [Minicystis rosea]